jgi:hypothetical protein
MSIMCGSLDEAATDVEVFDTRTDVARGWRSLPAIPVWGRELVMMVVRLLREGAQMGLGTLAAWGACGVTSRGAR